MLAIKGKVFERATSIKFLDILLNEHLSWKNPISVVENNYCVAKPHSNKTEKNSQANKDRLFMLQNIQGKRMEEMKYLSIYKLKIYQVLTFMFKIKRNAAPTTLRNNFREISQRYSTWFSQSKFVEGNIQSHQTKIAFSLWGPKFWNRLLNQEQKSVTYINDFKNLVKTSHLCLENEIRNFWICGRNTKNKNSGKKIKDNNYLYCVLSDSHCVKSDIFSCGFTW